MFTQIKTILLDHSISQWLTTLAIGTVVFFMLNLATGFLIKIIILPMVSLMLLAFAREGIEFACPTQRVYILNR